ncbi:MAG: hypothetical protein EOP11_05465 [Proteobacteria bacterium]|nr:MAG: hypothetical protein EOP11_05465 [Pseudomonadota bacterium]
MKIRAASLLVLPLLLAGCESPKFGEDLQSFVDRRAYEVSETASRSKLKLAWNDALFTAISSGISRNEYVIAESSKVPLPSLSKTLSLDDALQGLAAADHGIVALANLELETASTVATLDKLSGICESRESFDALGLGEIAENMVREIVVPRPEHNPSITVNTNPYTMAGDFAGDFISRHRYNKQVKLANAAMASIPEKVIQPTAAFEISKLECKKSIEARWQEVHQVRRAAANLGEAMRFKIRALLAIRRAAERKVITAGLAEAAQSSGYAKLIEEIQASNFRGNLDIGLVQANEELRVLRKATNNSGDCLERLKAMEAYHDALAENQAILKHLDAQAADDGLGQRVRALAKKVNAAKLDFDAKQKLLAKEACR